MTPITPQVARPRSPLDVARDVLTWLLVLGFLAWAIRLAVLEGYIYEIPGNFAGDFIRTVQLGNPEWYSGHRLFYGPIFVLESRFLFVPRLL
jgi:hypothetical protein